MTTRGGVLVWGNCQAGPVAGLLDAPLRAHGLEVHRVPPVYLVDAAGLAHVHELVARCAVLVSQPVSEEYSLPGCGTAHLAGLLPVGGRLVTFPVAFHVGAFPAMAHGHDGADRRVDAPLTDYHDLRMLVAARDGRPVADTVAGWAIPPAAATREIAAASLTELRRRERGLDVAVSDLLAGPDALWTMTHPSNAVLAQTARRILTVLGLDGDVVPRDVEYLGQRRAPVEPAVAAAHGWPASGRTTWSVDGRDLPLAEQARVQLGYYAAHPDVVARTLEREAVRVRALGLG